MAHTKIKKIIKSTVMRKVLGRKEKGPGESFPFLPKWKEAASLFERQMKVKPLEMILFHEPAHLKHVSPERWHHHSISCSRS